MTAPCSHGMPSPGSCIDCMADGNLPPAPRPEPETVEFYLNAKFQGQCPICDLPIMLGDRIAATTYGRYVHERCEK